MKQRDRKGGFLLPIIGAGIVLITFVLKDAVRKNLRDISDQLDRELNFSLLLQRDREIFEKLDYAYQRIRYPNLNQGPSTDLGATSDPYQNLMTMRTLIRATILPNLDVIGRLLAVSAHNKSLDAEANQLRSRLNALSAQSFEIEHASFPHAPEPLTPGNEYDSAKRKVVEFTLAL